MLIRLSSVDLQLSEIRKYDWVALTSSFRPDKFYRINLLFID